MEVSGHFAPATYPMGRILILIEYGVGWAPVPVRMFCRRENLIPVPGFETQTVQLIAS